MGELIHVPPVLLTNFAYHSALREGVTDVEPDRDHMLAVCQVSETDPEWLPDITIFRERRRAGNMWDVTYTDADPMTTYYGTSELTVEPGRPTEPGRLLQVVRHELLANHAHATGKKVMELTVGSWKDIEIGLRFAEALQETKTARKSTVGKVGDSVRQALGEAFNILTGPQGAPGSRSYAAWHVSRHLRPYIITGSGQ